MNKASLCSKRKNNHEITLLCKPFVVKMLQRGVVSQKHELHRLCELSIKKSHTYSNFYPNFFYPAMFWQKCNYICIKFDGQGIYFDGPIKFFAIFQEIFKRGFIGKIELPIIVFSATVMQRNTYNNIINIIRL